jgi:hypothetical protein
MRSKHVPIHVEQPRYPPHHPLLITLSATTPHLSHQQAHHPIPFATTACTLPSPAHHLRRHTVGHYTRDVTFTLSTSHLPSHHFIPLTTTSPCPPMHPVTTTQHLSHSVEHSTTSVTSSSPPGRHNTTPAIFPSTHHPVSHKLPLAYLPVYHIISSAATPRLPQVLHVSLPATTTRLSQHPIPTPSITTCPATKPVPIKPPSQYLSHQPEQPVQCSQHHQSTASRKLKPHKSAAPTSPHLHHQHYRPPYGVQNRELDARPVQVVPAPLLVARQKRLPQTPTTQSA